MASQDGLFGDIQFSLAMEKAFDTVHKDIILQALHQLALLPDILIMIQIWLTLYEYHICFEIPDWHHRSHQGEQTGIHWRRNPLDPLYVPNHGRFSPKVLLWLIAWISHSRCLLCTTDGLNALSDLAHILHTFRSCGFNINSSKALFSFGQMVAKITYLGIVLGYMHFRRMTRSPVHFAHENITNFFNRLDVKAPWTLIQTTHNRLTNTLAIKHAPPPDQHSGHQTLEHDGSRPATSGYMHPQSWLSILRDSRLCSSTPSGASDLPDLSRISPPIQSGWDAQELS